MGRRDCPPLKRGESSRIGSQGLSPAKTRREFPALGRRGSPQCGVRGNSPSGHIQFKVIKIFCQVVFCEKFMNNPPEIWVDLHKKAIEISSVM